jgi:hypothetical protein
MIHYTCDLCAKDLTGEARFVAKIEVFADHDPAELTDEDLDQDHMEAVAQMIQEMEENGETAVVTPTTKQFRYDLCSECHARVLRDPLGREHAHKVVFSKN